MKNEQTKNMLKDPILLPVIDKTPLIERDYMSFCSRENSGLEAWLKDRNVSKADLYRGIPKAKITGDLLYGREITQNPGLENQLYSHGRASIGRC